MEPGPVCVYCGRDFRRGRLQYEDNIPALERQYHVSERDAKSHVLERPTGNPVRRQRGRLYEDWEQRLQYEDYFPHSKRQRHFSERDAKSHVSERQTENPVFGHVRKYGKYDISERHANYAVFERRPRERDTQCYSKIRSLDKNLKHYFPPERNYHPEENPRCGCLVEVKPYDKAHLYPQYLGTLFVTVNR